MDGRSGPPSQPKRNPVTFVMNWDGKNVTGQINPGSPDSIPLASVLLDVTNWSVRIEADTKDQSGKPVHISAEGKIEDIANYHRSFGAPGTVAQSLGEFQGYKDGLNPSMRHLGPVVGFGLLATTPAFAQNGFSATYDSARQVKPERGGHQGRLGEPPRVLSD